MRIDTHPLARFGFCPVCGSPRFLVNDEKSKRCARCGLVYYLNPAAATVAVITNGRGELLVARRAKEPARGTLDLPGGFCDCRETAEEGLAREVREETGLEVTGAEYLFSLPNVYPYGGMDVHTVDLFFRCRVDGAAGARAADDAAELMWKPLDEVRAEDFGLRSVRRGVALLLAKNERVGKGQTENCLTFAAKSTTAQTR